MNAFQIAFRVHVVAMPSTRPAPLDRLTNNEREKLR